MFLLFYYMRVEGVEIFKILPKSAKFENIRSGVIIAPSRLREAEEVFIFIYMNLYTAEQTVNFIADHIENRKCLIQWFGGEPLMNIPVIDFISDKLGSILGNDRVRFVMMTNASLAAPEVVCKMKQRWNLSIVQITLDGTRDEYERRKNYLSIKRSFDVVIGNIKSILQTGIKVSIRLNYDKKNCSALCELIQYLREQNFHRMNNLSVYSYPIFCTGENQRDNSPGWEELNAIRKSLVENGFVLPLEAYSLNKRKNQCYGCSAKSFAILPDGSLFKCTTAMKYPYAQVGSIWKGITRYDVIDKWCSVALDSSCSQCCFLPVCQGGCRAGFLHYISDKCMPQKKFADCILRERVKYLSRKTVT